MLTLLTILLLVIILIIVSQLLTRFHIRKDIHGTSLEIASIEQDIAEAVVSDEQHYAEEGISCDLDVNDIQP